MVGIYKIQSPTGKVYIGKSVNIERRWRVHRWKNIKERQPRLGHSFKKYGVENHIFSVVHELPKDIDRETLMRYEQIYMDQYRKCGFRMLNMCAVKGSPYGMRRSKDQKERQRNFLLGNTYAKGHRHTEEAKKKIKAKRALQTNVKGPKGRIAWNRGMKNQYTTAKKGRPVSEEMKKRISLALTGKKLSAESIKKREAARALIPRKPWTDEMKKAHSLRHMGIKQSEESKKRRSASLISFHQKKKESA